MIASVIAFAPPIAGGGVWKKQNIRRTGKAPLAFTGCQLLAASQPCGPMSDAAISIWARKTGGFVLAWTTWNDGAIMQNATTLLSLSDVMDLLEDTCKLLDCGTTVFHDDAIHTSGALTAFIAEVQHRTNFAHAFSSIAGEALSFCDEYLADAQVQS